MASEREYDDIKVRITPTEMNEAVAEAEAGSAALVSDRLRARIIDGRSTAINVLANKELHEATRDAVRAILRESHNSMAELDRRLQGVADDRHAQRMIELADASNNIASNAKDQARALKGATWALVIVTAVLIVATIVGAFIARG